MTEPHFHDDRAGEPSRTRRVIEHRDATGAGTNWAALMLAAVLTVFIIVLVFGYLL